MTGRRVAVSTQEKNPRSAVIRTVVVAALTLFPILNLTLGIIVEEMRPYGDVVPGWVFGILNAGIVVTTVALAILTRVLAIPGVNEFFRSHFTPLSPEDKTKVDPGEGDPDGDPNDEATMTDGWTE